MIDTSRPRRINTADQDAAQRPAWGKHTDMLNNRLLRAGLLGTTLLAGGLSASGALAAAFQLRENSAYQLGMAFAGSGSSANTPQTVFENPAGMTQLQGLQVQSGGSIIVPSFVFKGTATNAFGRPVSGESDRDGGDFALVPHIHATYGIMPGLTVGLSITNPYGLATYYGPNFVGRYQADKTDLKTFNINPAIAYQVTNWLSLGAGVSALYGRAQFASALNSSTIGTQALGRPVALQDGYFRLKGDDVSVGWNVGALFQPGPQTNIGLAYRSRVNLQLDGSADFFVPAPLSANPRFRNSAANAKLTLPDTATISITQGIGPRLTVSADVTWTNWSQFKNLAAYRTDGALLINTPQRYDNSYFAALGASYKLTDKLEARVGTAYDKSPVSNDYRTARVPDASRWWLAVGASYQVLPGIKLDVGYAHLFVNEAKIREVSTTNDVLLGKFKSSVDIISFGTRASF